MSSSIEKGTSSLNSEATDLERSAQPVSTFAGGRVHRVKELNKEGNAVQEVRSAALVVATQSEHKTATWSRAALVMYYCIFVSFLGSCANGYDGSLMNAINGMATYQAKFESGKLGATTGIIFAIYTVGNMAGAFVSGPLADRWGRRVGMFVGSLIIIIGSVIVTSAETRGQFIAGRFILGFGIAPVTCACPSYCVEIAPPAWRGRATGFYNCGWFGGSIPAAAITLGTSYMTTDWAWRLPLLFQCFPAIVVCLSVFFLPESPRWLIANDRDDEARAILVRYHGNGDPASPLVELEWAEMKADISTTGSDKTWWDYRDLFRNKNTRWRTFMVLTMGIFGQFSGNGLGYFNVVIYESLGYGSIQQFVLNLVNSITSAIGAGGGVAVADRASRRPILIWGTLGCAALLGIHGALSETWGKMEIGQQDLNIGRAAVAFFFLFNILYSATYSPLQALYPVECLHTSELSTSFPVLLPRPQPTLLRRTSAILLADTRAKGMSLYAFTVSAVGFINAYAGPIGLKNMGNHYIFIFVAWDCVEALWWYFFCVETQGRTLEELEEIFSAARPVAASQAKKRVVVQEGGNVLVESEK